MLNTEMDKVFREYLDLSSRENLHLVNTLNEASQGKYLVSLTSKLYDKIQEKATRIDYSTIEVSRGDITKIQNFAKIVESLEILRKIVIEYREDPAPVDTIFTAIENLKSRKQLFSKAFTLGSSFPILVYNNIALAIVESTSFLITTCIEYIKDPGSETFKMALDKIAYQKSAQNLLFRSLIDFNEACKSGNLDNALNLTMNKAIARREAAELDKKLVDIEKDHPYLTDEEIRAGKYVAIHDDKENLKEGVFGAIASITSYGFNQILLWILNFCLPFIMRIVYLFYFQAQKISNYYADMADFCELNAYNIMQNQEYSTYKKSMIADKQAKLAIKYRKRANEFDIDYNMAKAKAAREEIKDKEKYDPKTVEKEYNDKYDSSEDNVDIGAYGSIFESEITKEYEPFVFESPFESAYIDDRIKCL
jgi:hypothetical protein